MESHRFSCGGLEKKYFSPPQIAARAVSKQDSQLLKHFSFRKSIVVLCNTRLVVSRITRPVPESHDKTLANAQKAVNITCVRAGGPSLACRTR